MPNNSAKHPNAIVPGKPRFQVGDRVVHRSRKAYGTVTSIINLRDVEDIQLHGFRYVIQHSGWDWSIPESALRAVNKSKNGRTDSNKISDLEGGKNG